MTVRAAVRVGRPGSGVLAAAAVLVMLTGGVSGAEGAGGVGGPSGAGGAGGVEAPGGGQQADVDGALGAGPGSGGGIGSGSGGVGGRGFDMRIEARFSPPNAFVPSSAVTYDTELVPAAAWISVEQRSDHSGTRVATWLRGLVPNRVYGMHVHTAPCGADPKAAGPHYQHRASATADPDNEVWLDFRTDRHGNGSAWARHGWGFREGGARSVIIHDVSGGAGERVACFTVPFGSHGRV
ncbi:superoxide dismutase family protein [Streptomyces sp. NBC_01433]|uniref:superoxide dismutase family protein n=1 Tax=Streptomyces sp. NBC_01433 TaxID=2903864 RepID=UPI002257B4A3|nr:superoxide dismutase family protein [Streptomyces sp. NBC_01433]MCX4677504.1 superoxide dismutase family protein [Streptomyces sp. NBC_01433]